MDYDGNDFRPVPTFSALAPRLRDISRASCRLQLGGAIGEAVQSVGCEYYVFAASVPVGDDMPFTPTLSSLPREVVDAMMARGLYRSNPVLTRLRESNGAVVVAPRIDDPNPVVAAVSRLVEPLGIVGAALVPVLSATNDLSILGAYSCRGVPTPEAISALRLIGTAASIRLLELHGMVEPPKLTDTQARILHWAAAGKSNGDIAEIAGLTRRNCEYHLGEIYRKLGVATRSQAIAALMEGRVQSSLSAGLREK